MTRYGTPAYVGQACFWVACMPNGLSLLIPAWANSSTGFLCQVKGAPASIRVRSPSRAIVGKLCYLLSALSPVLYMPVA